MLCDECGKKEATVHIMQIGPDGRMERNLCEECAASFGKWLYEPLLNQKDVTANEFFQNIFRGTQEQKQETNENDLLCPSCGMRYEEFQKVGILGCPQCYGAFRKQLEPILRRVHGLSIHNGKIPNRPACDTMELQREILRLRAKLQQAIEQEAYELAAEYRDRLRELEQQEKEVHRHGE